MGNITDDVVNIITDNWAEGSTPTIERIVDYEGFLPDGDIVIVKQQDETRTIIDNIFSSVEYLFDIFVRSTTSYDRAEDMKDEIVEIFHQNVLTASGTSISADRNYISLVKDTSLASSTEYSYKLSLKVNVDVIETEKGWGQ